MARSRGTVRWFAALAAVATASLCLGVLGTRLVRSPAQVAADAKPPAPTLLSVPVTTGRLDRTVVLRGKVVLGDEVRVRPPDGGEGVPQVHTAVPRGVGSAVTAGASVMEVSDRPVFVLPGRVPMLRDVTVGTSGPDVTRLQTGLRAAGISVADPPGVYGASTQAAVAELYRRGGYAPPTQVPPTSEAPEGDDEDERRPAPPSIAALRSEIAFVPRLPATVVAGAGAVGSPLDKAGIVLTTSEPKVVADVSADQADTLRRMSTVVLTGADGVRTRGRITSIGAVRQRKDVGFVARLTVRPVRALPVDADGQEVQVVARTKASSSAALTVPVAAVHAAADGETSVVRVEGRRTRRVGVRVMRTSDGYVQIAVRRHAVRAGDRVAIGIR